MKIDSENLHQQINNGLNKTVGVVSLGCDKNRVDSEKMLGFLSEKFRISSEINECEVLIINTCSFLASSRKESIDTILEFAQLKEQKLEKLIVTGCLPQKFVDELFDALPEVDAFLGTFDYSLINDTIEKLYQSDKVNRYNFVGCGKEISIKRILTTPEHYAYLKIADGCNNHCTYCLIPKIRGKYKSYPMEDLVLEAKNLGYLQEIILVAQDTTRYGEDLYGENKLIELIKKLSALDNIEKIRLMYCYPEKITDELIAEIKNNDKLLKYVDVPLQHADDGILKLMNRGGSYAKNLQLVKKLKELIPEIAIRSTFIAGFPREGEKEFSRLVEFINEAELFNAGFFAYSKEEGTAAYLLSGQVDAKTKKQRTKLLYQTQKNIVKKIMQKFVNQTLDVVCDGVDYKKQMFYGRAYFNAPDVDGLIYLKSNEVIEQGKKYQVKILKAKDYDLYGEVIK